MKIFYFTATGNCLDVAKHFDCELYSMPKILKGQKYDFEDTESIGLVFPCHSLFVPEIVMEFIEKVKLQSPYIFAIITYGNVVANAPNLFFEFAEKHNIHLNYVKSLLMVDNYLPIFDMEKQITMDKKTNQNLVRMIEEIHQKKKHISKATVFNILLTRVVRFLLKVVPIHSKDFQVSDACSRCQTCARVCPRDNIVVKNRPVYGDKCVFCLACINLCPQKAITLKKEANASARYKNQNISIKEIIDSND